MRKKPFLILGVSLLILSSAVTGCKGFPGQPESAPMQTASSALLVIPEPVSTTLPLKNIDKFGNVALTTRCKDFLSAGYQYGDIVTVAFPDRSMDLPFCSSYTDVDTGDTALLARSDSEYLQIAVDMGDFASTQGFAVKNVAPDGTISWTPSEAVSDPIEVTITMKEPAGYYPMYLIHQLAYTNDRDDYHNLTDAEFANFRAAETTGMGKDVLFRSASPINPEYARNTYADQALSDAGISHIINLADSEEEAQGYEGFAETRYAALPRICLDMDVSFTNDTFREKLAAGLRFIAENPGKYLIHCNEGKDRTGIVLAILEGYMGASWDEITDDFMKTFYNYYGVTPEDPRYTVIITGTLTKTLSAMLGVEDLPHADLKVSMENYMKEIGLTEKELDALRTNLRGEE